MKDLTPSRHETKVFRNGIRYTRANPFETDKRKVEEHRLRSGTLLALLVVYLFMFAFEVETSVYGWAVLAVICVLAFVMVVIWLMELKRGDI